jgi:hypothetical protein
MRRGWRGSSSGDHNIGSGAGAELRARRKSRAAHKQAVGEREGIPQRTGVFDALPIISSALNRESLIPKGSTRTEASNDAACVSQSIRACRTLRWSLWMNESCYGLIRFAVTRLSHHLSNKFRGDGCSVDVVACVPEVVIVGSGSVVSGQSVGGNVLIERGVISSSPMRPYVAGHATTSLSSICSPKMRLPPISCGPGR